jgi:hypothetical protein
MASLDPHLGAVEACAILEPSYACKLGDGPVEERRRVAVIVNHGMGQQVPYETIEGVANAVWRGIARQTNKMAGSGCLIRRVRLGIEGNDEDETELVRAEIEFQNGQHIYSVHIYESYWAPLTEGRVTLKDVMQFLFNAGWNGFVNTQAKKGFQRWMFGSEHEFKLPKLKLIMILIFPVLMLLALVIMNVVLGAAATSHVIGASSGFPGSSTMSLTFDFIVADLAAGLIALGTWVLPSLYKLARKKTVTPRWLSLLGWILIVSGSVLMVLAASAMVVEIMGGHVRGFWWPYVSDCAVWLFPGHKVLIIAVWVIELFAAYKIRWFLVEFVGDVAAYVAAHTVSKFWELRQQIWYAAMKVARGVYRARLESTAEPETVGFLYEKIIVAGHSLGSVIGYDALNGLFLEDGFSKAPLRIAQRTRMFLTFGSPLDKTAFLFRTQQDMCSPVREVAAAAGQPMIQSYSNRPQEWVNLYSKSDIISGPLDFYDPPNKDNAKNTVAFQDPATAPTIHERAVKNLLDPDARTPFAAHVEYWKGQLFADQLVRGITT